MTLRQKLANITLFAATIFFFILLGGGNYEAINITPKIAKAVPQSLSMLQGPYGFLPIKFWVIFHPLAELLLILALIFNWRVSIYRRKILIPVMAVVILVHLATLTYFAPETGVIASAPYSDTIDATLTARAQRWESLNHLRLAAYYAISIALLFAVNRNMDSVRK